MTQYSLFFSFFIFILEDAEVQDSQIKQKSYVYNLLLYTHTHTHTHNLMDNLYYTTYMCIWFIIGFNLDMFLLFF